MADMYYETDPCAQIQEILNQFDQLDEKTENAAMAAVSAAGDVIVNRQKQLCPVKTGRLRGSIKKISVYKNSSGNFTCRCGLDLKHDPGLLYGIFVEFGRPGFTRNASNGVDKNGNKVTTMRAQPYIRAGHDAAKEDAYKAMADTFFKEMGLDK